MLEIIGWNLLMLFGVFITFTIIINFNQSEKQLKTKKTIKEIEEVEND